MRDAMVWIVEIYHRSHVMKEIIDQPLHFLWAFIALVPVLYRCNSRTALLSAFLLCLPRELIDQWHGWPIGPGKLLDMSFFLIGGWTAGKIFEILRARKEKI